MGCCYKTRRIILILVFAQCTALQAYAVFEDELNMYVGYPTTWADRMTDYMYGDSPSAHMEVGFVRAPFWAVY